MPMASTIQPYADVKNRPANVAMMEGIGAGDALMLQMEDTAINKQKAQLAATAGQNRASMGPMTLSALSGNFFG